jgi:hypothetical protein
MPNWLFANLMTVPIRFSRVSAVDVALGSGELVKVCDCVALVADAVSTGTLGVAALLSALPVQPTSATEHAARSSAMMRIRMFPSDASTVPADELLSR